MLSRLNLHPDGHSRSIATVLARQLNDGFGECCLSYCWVSGIFTARQANTVSLDRTTSGLNHPKELQHQEYDGDNDQRVNPTTCLRKPWAYIPTEKAEKPQYYQNYD